MRRLLAVALSVGLVASAPAFGQSLKQQPNFFELFNPNFSLKKKPPPEPKPPKPPKCTKPTKKNPTPSNPCPKDKSSLEQGNVIVTVGLDRKIFFG